MSVPTTGQVYGDKENTPVPMPRYRCKSTAAETRPHAPHSTLTHPCKLAVDHDAGHRCICGRTWDRPVPVKP
jgi:hypothetical protein